MSKPDLSDGPAAWHIKELVNATCQKVVIQLYLELTPDTPIAERAYAVMLTKSELEASLLHK